MCGIVGTASAGEPVDRELLLAQRDTMSHRGPDDAGIWLTTDCSVGLAHRRLSIFDLTASGHQPMADAGALITVVLNGEIYNFRQLRAELSGKGYVFRSQSDTEVLITAYLEWGRECLSRLNGMFAFALFDARTRELLLARDRAGEKPLFFRHAKKRFSFASEIKALFRDPAVTRTVSLPAFDHYLAYGYVPGGLCLVEGISKLPPAHALVYSLATDAVECWNYWKLPSLSAPSTVTVDSLADELGSLLEDSVALQLAADVPVGVLLSGGIDSSLVTAFASTVSSRPVRTYTVVFPEHSQFNEGPYARIVAQHFGTVHTELEAQAASVDVLPLLARQYDEPIGDSSMVPTYIVSKLIRSECTVALGGDGGDELFGGYPQYSWMLRHRAMLSGVPRFARRAAARVADWLPLGVRGRTYLLASGEDPDDALAFASVYLDAQSRRRIAPGLRSVVPVAERYRSRRAAGGTSVVQRMTSSDFATYLPDNILVKVDRASMLNSLEVRAPFLDYRIIEFAFGRVPDRFRADMRRRKILLQVLAARVLPKELDLTRKQGFSLPLQYWFKGDWGVFIGDVLRSAPPEVYDRRIIERLLRGQQRGLYNSQRLFLLAMFELWRREYGVSMQQG